MQITRINIMWKDTDINSVSFAFEDGIADVYSVNYSNQPEWNEFITMFNDIFVVSDCDNICLNLYPTKNIVAIYDYVTKLNGYLSPVLVNYDDLPNESKIIYDNFVNYIINQQN